MSGIIREDEGEYDDEYDALRSTPSKVHQNEHHPIILAAYYRRIAKIKDNSSDNDVIVRRAKL